MEKLYALNEYGHCRYKTSNFIFCVHEMLSLILERGKNTKIYHYNPNELIIEEIHNELPVHGHNQDQVNLKQFAYVKNTFEYDIGMNQLRNVNNERYVNIDDDVCNRLMDRIKEYHPNQYYNAYLQAKPVQESIVVSNNHKTIKTPTFNELVADSTNLLKKSTETIKNIKREIIQPTQTIPDNVIINDNNNNNNNNDNSIQNVENVENIENLDNTDDNTKMKLILEQIEQLQKLKESANDALESVKKAHDEDRESFANLNADVNFEKKKIYIEKEREKSRRTKFLADKKTYYLIKNDIVNKKITEKEISELFTQKYKIFKYMEEHNMLNIEDVRSENDEDIQDVYDLNYDITNQSMDKDYFIYSQILTSLTGKTKPKSQFTDKYVPHNYHYLTDDEQIKFADASEMLNKEHIIEDFMKKNNRVKSLKQILKDLDSDDSEVHDSESESDESDRESSEYDSPDFQDKLEVANDFANNVKDTLETYSGVDMDHIDDSDNEINDLYDADIIKQTVEKARHSFY